MFDVVKKVDMIELRKLQILPRSGNVWVYSDGSVVHVNMGTIPNNDDIVAIIPCIGLGDIDESLYAEGWAEYDSDRDIYISDDGRELTSYEMVEESIETGSFDYSDLIYEIKRQVEYGKR